MNPATQGLVVLVVTLAVLLTGAPVAFGLGALSIAFLVIFHGLDSLQVVAETLWSGLDDFTLVSIPMFVMMGAAIGSSPAGQALYKALDRWLHTTWLYLAGLLIGIVAGFVELVRTTMKPEKKG